MCSMPYLLTGSQNEGISQCLSHISEAEPAQRHRRGNAPRLKHAFKERFVQVGFVFLLAIMAYAVYNDVMRMLPIHS
jgi:hypothetical protein